MQRVLGWVDTVSDWSGKVVSMLILVMIGVLLWEVALRYIFNSPTIWAHEVTEHMFGAYSVLVGAYVLLHNEHVKIDVIYDRFSPRKRAIFDSITYLLFFLMIGAMLVYGVEKAARSIAQGEVSITYFAPPVYPVRCTIPVAALLILLQGLAKWIRVLNMAIKGEELA